MKSDAFYNFENRVALITGGTTGIGKATAAAFLQAGSMVAIIGRNRERGESAQKELSEAGGQVLYIQADISEPHQVRKMVSRTIEKFGRLDFAFNNAAIEFIHGIRPITEATETDYDTFFRTNVESLVFGLKYEIPAILETAGKGTIVNMTSMAGQGPLHLVSNLYSATRHAINGLTTNAARDWASKGIRINAVAPGLIESGRGKMDPEYAKARLSEHPIGRFGRPEEVAEAVLWLCSDRSSFVVGHILFVDGGLVLR